MKTLILDDEQVSALLELLMKRRLDIVEELERIESYIKNQEYAIGIVSTQISRLRGITQEKIDEELDKLEPEKRRVRELKVSYNLIENLIQKQF